MATEEWSEIVATIRTLTHEERHEELLDVLEGAIQKRGMEARNFQNLLLMSAARINSPKIHKYIEELNNYDAPEIANVLMEAGCYEEAFKVYVKFEVHDKAMRVLLDKVGDISRGYQYAIECDKPPIWMQMGRAFLELPEALPAHAIYCYLKAEEAGPVELVIEKAKAAGEWESLIQYLLMAQRKAPSTAVDNALAFAFASTQRIFNLIDLLNKPNLIQVFELGKECQDHGFNEAAKELFKSIEHLD
ncbi:hypothetical protein L596_025252 [Steinernema carpocapsae]|uniref:Clathrin heavy chain linker core motif domain-containing protein n=1 Tax=Steinernema carpocapsae TaxID=34508 RepID=A0A4U5M785_STECR|nr:hypothetical protein L596_025252 [Steinernema carpocapsae]